MLHIYLRPAQLSPEAPWRNLLGDLKHPHFRTQGPECPVRGRWSDFPCDMAWRWPITLGAQASLPIFSRPETGRCVVVVKVNRQVGQTVMFLDRWTVKVSG